MTDPILHIHVGETLTNTLARAARTMEALEREETPPPYFSIGFADMSALLATLTPRRWQLLRVLREQGALSITELADQLSIETQQLEEDLATLEAWSLIQQDAAGRVRAPYSELMVEVKFPVAKAA